MGQRVTLRQAAKATQEESEGHTEEKKQETNAYRLSAPVSAASSLTVTTLSDTHRG